jgi:hypothetical protein
MGLHSHYTQAIPKEVSLYAHFKISNKAESVEVYRRVNMVEILCTYVWKWKNETWNYSRNGGKGEKENDGGGEFNYDVL